MSLRQLRAVHPHHLRQRQLHQSSSNDLHQQLLGFQLQVLLLPRHLPSTILQLPPSTLRAQLLQDQGLRLFQLHQFQSLQLQLGSRQSRVLHLRYRQVSVPLLSVASMSMRREVRSRLHPNGQTPGPQPVVSTLPTGAISVWMSKRLQ